MSRPDGFDRELLAAKHSLLIFARKLCRNPILAEDLVQMTMLRAIDKHESFQMGTRMGAWLCTILRHEYYNLHRTSGREVLDADGAAAASRVAMPDQVESCDLRTILRRVDQLPPLHRAGIELVVIDGCSYFEAGQVIGVPEGTVKSAVHRARHHLSRFSDGYVGGRQ